MKNFTLLFLITLLSQVMFAQRTTDLECFFFQPAQDTISTSGNFFPFEVRTRNYGPGTFLTTDYNKYYLTIHNVKYNFDGSKYTNQLGHFTSSFPPFAQGSFGLMNFPIDSIDNLMAINKVRVDFILNDTTSLKDTDTSNNTDYFILKYNFSSIPENTIENSISINQQGSNLNLKNSSNENLNYRIISIEGKLITSGSLLDNKKIDLSGKNAGVYIVNIYNSNEAYSKKLIIH